MNLKNNNNKALLFAVPLIAVCVALLPKRSEPVRHSKIETALRGEFSLGEQETSENRGSHLQRMNSLERRAKQAWKHRLEADRLSEAWNGTQFLDGLPVAKAKSLFEGLFAARGNIASDRIRRKLLQQAVRDPQLSEIAQKTLLSREFAQTAFGEEQGKARLYSIHLLSHLAKNGDADPLLRTTKRLVQRIERTSNSDTGRAEDVRALVESVSAITKPDELGPDFFEKIGYHSDQTEELKQHLRESVLFGQIQSVGLLEAQRITEKLFKGNL